MNIEVEILLYRDCRGCRDDRGDREGYGFLRKPIYIVGFADGLWLPNVLKRVRFLFSLHCTYKSPMRKAEKLTTGHHLSWDGKVAAEQPDRLYNRTRHTCG